MTQAATPPATDVSLFIPFTKVDDEQRIVGGWATVEEPDRKRKIVDYESARDAMLAWGGNMREMHDPTRAVGKSVSVIPDDGARRVWLESQVSKSADGDNTWAKILEGVLTGYSIHGFLSRRVPTLVKQAGKVVADAIEYVRVIDEVSYVDVPAAPSAVFQFAKSADFLADLPADGEPAAVDEAPPADEASAPSEPDHTDGDAALAGAEGEPGPVGADFLVGPVGVPGAETSAETGDGTEAQKSAADDVALGTFALNAINTLIQGEALEQDAPEVAALRDAAAALMRFLGTEQAEVGVPEEVVAAAAATLENAEPEPVVVIANAATAPETPTLIVGAPADSGGTDMPIGDTSDQDVVAKASGRLQAAHDAIHSTHDTLMSAGADCAGFGKSADLETASGLTDDEISKIASSVGAQLTPLVADVAAMKATLGDVEAEVAKFAKTPMPGGPLRYADGRDGRLEPVNGSRASSDPEIALLEKAAGSVTDPALREELGLAVAERRLAAKYRGETPQR